MALGKLSAGLAHELNNPATAVRRDADALDEQLARLPELTRMLLVHGIDAEALARAGAWLAAWAKRATSAASEAAAPGALERSRLEQEIGAWLDERGVRESWMLVEPLVGAGLSPDDLCQLTDGVAAEALSDFVTWFTAIIGAQNLARDIRAASGRITELVGSVKVYSHMDRAGDRERTDLREGIDSTLVMLGHKLKRKNITLERDYAPDLPPVSALAGELNQVWTNLADNAIDAMPIMRCWVETAQTVWRSRVVGNGAHSQLQSRIFRAFFTAADRRRHQSRPRHRSAYRRPAAWREGRRRVGARTDGVHGAPADRPKPMIETAAAVPPSALLSSVLFAHPSGVRRLVIRHPLRAIAAL